MNANGVSSTWPEHSVFSGNSISARALLDILVCVTLSIQNGCGLIRTDYTFRKSKSLIWSVWMKTDMSLRDWELGNRLIQRECISTNNYTRRDRILKLLAMHIVFMVLDLCVER